MLQRHAESTLQVATALNPHIGYDSATEIVKEAADLAPHGARGGAREGRRRGGPRRGARLREDGPPARVNAQPIERVSTLELFFDLVFVFTITQLTAVLAHHPTGKGLAQAVLMIGVIWWMYGGYAWLTNTVRRRRSASSACCCSAAWPAS